MIDIEAKVREWADPELRDVNIRLQHLSKRLFKSYEPTIAGREEFWRRLAKWLGNVTTDDDMKILFRLAPEIFYIGPDEFHELYRSAYNGIIARWTIDTLNIDVLQADAQVALANAVAETWFCPVSDSMRINSFYHTNNLQARMDYRPDWRSLQHFSTIDTVRRYCQDSGIKRLVLLEDFVGGGSQVKPAIEFAASLLPAVRVLFVPLVICPTGAVAMETLMNAHPGLRCEAVITLSEKAFLTTAHSPFDLTETANIRDLLARTYQQVSHGSSGGNFPPYSIYGYPAHDPVGGLIVMFSNTPDNTIPLIHYRSTRWEPIFPRHSRI